MSIRDILPPKVKSLLNSLLRRDQRAIARDFQRDCNRFTRYSGYASPNAHDAVLARLVLTYHVLEKGLTMPERRLGFGKDVVRRLMALVGEFTKSYGEDNNQVRHAIGVLKEYQALHAALRNRPREETKYWDDLNKFVSRYPDIDAEHQLHMTRDEFFADTESSFPAFAVSRHTLRNYSQEELPVEKISASVTLAMTAPSACNRQYIRVHCLNDSDMCQRLLMLQKGCRGFGHLANKVLVVTADIEGIDSSSERNDVFTNGGIFLMNLCYALHYNKIAHCVLNWSRSEADDNAARALLGPQLKNSETIVAVLSCGLAPEEFDVAASPRKNLDEVLVVHETRSSLQ